MMDKSPIVQEDFKVEISNPQYIPSLQKNRKRVLPNDSSSAFNNPNNSPTSPALKKSKKDISLTNVSIQSVVPPSIVAPPPLLPSQMNFQTNEKQVDTMMEELNTFSNSATENRFSLIGPDVKFSNFFFVF